MPTDDTRTPDPLLGRQIDEFMGWLFRDGGLEPPRREYDTVRQRIALFAHRNDARLLVKDAALLAALADSTPEPHDHFDPDCEDPLCEVCLGQPPAEPDSPRLCRHGHTRSEHPDCEALR